MESRKITVKSKLMYGCGDIFGGGAFLVISLLFLNFLTDVEMLSPALSGSIFLIGKIWDAVSDPLMGTISDRTKSKYGRRRVYFLFGILPIFFSFFMLWYSFGLKSQSSLFLYYLFAYLLFNTAFTMVMIPYTAILADMTQDYKERTSFSGFRLTFSASSAILAGVVPKIIINRFSYNLKFGYMIMGLIFGIFYALPWIFVFLGTWENKRFEENNTNKSSLFEDLKIVFKNKAFRIHAGMFISSQTAVDFLTTIVIYYLTYYLGRPQSFSLVLGGLLVTQVVCMPLHIKISKKYGKTAPLKIGLSIWFAAMLIALFIKPTSKILFVVLIAAISGIGTSSSVFVPWSIISEVADVDEMISAKRREGLYCGMATLLRKTAQAVTVFIIGVLLQWIGYVPNVEQMPNVKLGIKLMFSCAPMVFIIIAFLFANKYSMTEEKYYILMDEIKRRKNGGKAEEVDIKVKQICEELTGLEYMNLWQDKSNINKNTNLSI